MLAVAASTADGVLETAISADHEQCVSFRVVAWRSEMGPTALGAWLDIDLVVARAVVGDELD